jgi:hypothetical protein
MIFIEEWLKYNLKSCQLSKNNEDSSSSLAQHAIRRSFQLKMKRQLTFHTLIAFTFNLWCMPLRSHKSTPFGLWACFKTMGDHLLSLTCPLVPIFPSNSALDEHSSKQFCIHSPYQSVSLNLNSGPNWINIKYERLKIYLWMYACICV